MTRHLTETAWRPLARAHATRVDALSADHLERRRRGAKHPVWDFMWNYYSFRPGQLRRWHPGAGVVLQGAQEHAGWRHYVRERDGVRVDVERFLAERGDTVAFVRRLLGATSGRPAQLSCFGLHEWAMVYHLREGEQRHESWPLRLGHEGTDAVVEAHQLRCTHHDAFRFFTPDAVGRNAVAPTREGQEHQEQPGCLHATMDLYKWAYKLVPAVSSALIMACFELACEARTLDMRSSPYDLAALGWEPIRVETPEGKAEHVALQRGIAERGEELRRRFVAALDALAPDVL